MSYVGSTTGGATSGTSDRTVTFTPAAGALVVVFATLRACTNTVATCTDNRGGTYTLVKSALFNTNESILLCFVKNQAALNLSTVATVLSGPNNSGALEAIWFDANARFGSSAVRSSGSEANKTTETPAPALNQSCLTGNVTVGAIGCSTAAPNVTEPTSWLESNDASIATPDAGLETVIRNSGFTGTTVTWGSTVGAGAGAFASIILELDGSTPTATGTASITLGNVALSSAANVPVTATSAVTLGNMTVVGAGTVGSAGISGSASITLDGLTVAGVGSVPITAASAITLGSVTLSSSGAVVAGASGGWPTGPRNYISIRNNRGYR